MVRFATAYLAAKNAWRVATYTDVYKQSSVTSVIAGKR
jgi:hypothetical protein